MSSLFAMFVIRSGKNAPQHLCCDGRESDERWQGGVDL